jgi:hypothetical protein
MINVMDIEAQYTILGFKQNEKAAIKETFLTRRVYGSSSFRREDEEVCSNVKQQLVRVQNKALHDDGLLLTQHCFITITYLNFL